MLSEEEVRARLKAAIGLNQQKFAAQHGFTPGYISDVLHGKRALADRILATIGVERVIVYREKRS